MSENIDINKPWLDGFEFSIWMQDKLVSKNGWVIDTGNWETANAEIDRRLQLS